MAARVKAALKHKEAQDRTDQLSRQLLDMNNELERSLNVCMSDMIQARNALVLALARLVEYRSLETHAHLTRLRRYCTTLAQEAAGIGALADQIDPEFIDTLECCAPSMTSAMSACPITSFSKAVASTTRKPRSCKGTPSSAPIRCKSSSTASGRAFGFLRMAIDIARHHHEHYDGTGYPDRLAGTDIPLAARLLTIGDAYDALRSRRPQRPGLSHAASLQIMVENSSGKFDPLLLSASSAAPSNSSASIKKSPTASTSIETTVGG